MKILHNNVLVTQAEAETVTGGGIILQSDLTSGNKAAVVIAVSEAVAAAGLKQKDRVFLDWSKSMPIEVDGLKCAVIETDKQAMRG